MEISSQPINYYRKHPLIHLPNTTYNLYYLDSIKNYSESIENKEKYDKRENVETRDNLDIIIWKTNTNHSLLFLYSFKIKLKLKIMIMM